MAAFEPVVRSIEVLSTHTDRVAPTPEVADPEAYLKWGRTADFTHDGDFKTDALSIKDVTPFMFNGVWREEGREYEDFRVEDPEDKDQFVIVQRLTSVAFAGPPKTMYENNENPRPQLLVSFKNTGDQVRYKNSKGEDFEPITFDPFHTIVDVHWQSSEAVVLCWTVAPTTALGVDPEWDNDELNNYVENGKRIIRVIDRGYMVHTEKMNLTPFFHPAVKIAQPLNIQAEYVYAGQHSGVPGILTSENRVEYDDGGHLNGSFTYNASPNNDYIAFYYGGLSELLGDNYPAAYLSNPAVMGAIDKNFKITGLGADGYYLPNLDHAEIWWRFNVKSRTTAPGASDFYMVYEAWQAPWTKLFDPSPYSYGAAIVDISMLKRALMEIFQGHYTPILNFRAHAYDNLAAAEETYYGSGHLRAIWFAGAKDAIEKLDSLHIGSSGESGGGGGGGISLDGGESSGPTEGNDAGYIPQDEVLEMYTTGVGISGADTEAMTKMRKSFTDWPIADGLMMESEPDNRKDITPVFKDRVMESM